MTTEEKMFTLTDWQLMPVVDPELDSCPWEQKHIPVCVYDGRKWQSTKGHVIVNCSGNAEYWDDTSYGGYGYCAYHWHLRQQKRLTTTPHVQNPRYDANALHRDLTITNAFWEHRLEAGLPDHRQK